MIAKGYFFFLDAVFFVAGFLAAAFFFAGTCLHLLAITWFGVHAHLCRDKPREWEEIFFSFGDDRCVTKNLRDAISVRLRRSNSHCVTQKFSSRRNVAPPRARDTHVGPQSL
ncbi:MAG TPA: hypothetical protein VK530_18830 [Candidatus Acidoferrum sp.]|nr:hypothetical protein [Candidatus Acidoferrum sp.]